MQLHYLFVVVDVMSDVSDVKLTSYNVAVIFANYSAITRVVNNYNIGTKPCFSTEPNQTHSEPNMSLKKLNRNRTEIKNIFHISRLVLVDTGIASGCLHELVHSCKTFDDSAASSV